MFELVYTKIQKKYKYVSKLYAMLAVDKPFSLIAFYLISTLCLSIWIFQIRLITDNESLTYVKNSDYLKNKKTVDHEFPLEPKNRYFQNQLSDVGYYSEMILKLKNQLSKGIKVEMEHKMGKAEATRIALDHLEK